METNSWYNHYVGRMNDRYLAHVGDKYSKLIDSVATLASLRPDMKMSEIGCGAGNITRLVSQKLNIVKGNSGFGSVYNPRKVILDKCPDMLRLAHNSLLSAAVQHVAILGDALDLGHSKDLKDTDVFHSHGVLEHFTDREIRIIINEQLRMAKDGGHLVHYVPSYKYEQPSFGDERLLTPDQWREICKPDKIIEFNDGYDLILYWRAT